MKPFPRYTAKQDALGERGKAMNEHAREKDCYMPAAMALSLAEDAAARTAFAKMSVAEQDEMIRKARAAQDRNALRRLVKELYM